MRYVRHVMMLKLAYCGVVMKGLLTVMPALTWDGGRQKDQEICCTVARN